MQWSCVSGLLLALSVVGCSSSHEAGPVAADVDVGPESASAVEVTNTVVDAVGGAPIAGAKVCIVDRPDVACATSDDAGRYTMALPPFDTELDLAVTVSAPGHLGSTRLIHEPPNAVVWLSIPLWNDAAASTLMAQAGFTYPPAGKALVLVAVFRARGGAAVGATASILPASGKGPVYLDSVGTPDPTLIAITPDGYALFDEVEPGRIEVTVSDATCSPAVLLTNAWVDAKPNTIAGVAVADTMTQMSVICR